MIPQLIFYLLRLSQDPLSYVKSPDSMGKSSILYNFTKVHTKFPDYLGSSLNLFYVMGLLLKT